MWESEDGVSVPAKTKMKDLKAENRQGGDTPLINLPKVSYSREKTYLGKLFDRNKETPID